MGEETSTISVREASAAAFRVLEPSYQTPFDALESVRSAKQVCEDEDSAFVRGCQPQLAKILAQYEK